MPTPDSAQTIATALRLMREGRVQDADDLLAGHARDLAAESAGAGAAPEPPPPPRAVNAILLDFAHALYELMGSPAALQGFIQELDASFAAASSAESAV